LNVGVTLQDERSARENALDVWIEQERQLIAYYEARGGRADATAAAAVTAVFAFAALTATVPEASADFDKAYVWIIVVLPAVACVSALAARTAAGLRRSRTSWFSSGSDEFDTAIEKLRECDPTNPDPLDVRQRTLTLCIARATDAHHTAKSKDRAAAVAAAALAFALIGILVLRLTVAPLPIA
jgi:hypothetical protein